MTFSQNALFLLLSFPLLFCVNAYPSFYMIRNLPQLLQQLPNAAYSSAAFSSSLPRPKRAFDRLDESPFDFETISNRFDEGNELLPVIPLDDLYLPSSFSFPFDFEAFRERSSDRIKKSAFFGQQKQKVNFGQSTNGKTDS